MRAGVHRHCGHRLGERWRGDPVLPATSDHRCGPRLSSSSRPRPLPTTSRAPSSARPVSPTSTLPSGRDGELFWYWPQSQPPRRRDRHRVRPSLRVHARPCQSALSKPYHEGTVAFHARRGNGCDDVLALTVAHVARPPPMHPSNTHLSHKLSSKHREIAALGNKAFADSTTVIETRIGTLQEIIVSETRKIVTTAGRWHGRPREDRQGALARPTGCQQRDGRHTTAGPPPHPRHQVHGNPQQAMYWPNPARRPL